MGGKIERSGEEVIVLQQFIQSFPGQFVLILLQVHKRFEFLLYEGVIRAFLVLL